MDNQSNPIFFNNSSLDFSKNLNNNNSISNDLSNPPLKVIACVDMDAYYAQIESHRLKLDESVPLVVRQWDLIIAVNYAARKYGVQRCTPIDEAKRLCPNLVFAHVDTIKADDDHIYEFNNPSLDDDNLDINDSLIQKTGSRTLIEQKFGIHNPKKEKITLDYYREESAKIYQIFLQHCSKVEKASIDEVFLDVTQEVLNIINSNHYKNEWNGVIVGDSELQDKVKNAEESILHLSMNPRTELEKMLMIGSQIIHNIRMDILNTLKYTSSGGISYNKMLAKLASGMNKPNNQTIILPYTCQDVLKTIEIKKVRNFGGKVHQTFKIHNKFSMGDLQELSLETIENIIGGDKDSAKWIYFRCRGWDDEPVQEKNENGRSVMSVKRISPVYTIINLVPIIDLLVADLIPRITLMYNNNSMIAKSIAIHYYDHHVKSHRSKSSVINLNVKQDCWKKVLKEKAMELTNSIAKILFPCTMYGIRVSNFVKSDFKFFEYDLVSYINNQNLNGTKNQDNIASNEDLVKCEKCSEMIAQKSINSHMDFHLAQDLDKELNPHKRKYKMLTQENIEKEIKLEDVKKGNNEVEHLSIKRIKKNEQTIIKNGEIKNSKKDENKITLDKFFIKK